MATNVTLNGVSYSIPAVGESAWGASLSSYLVATATGFLSKAGGSFALTADVDFGANYGLKAVFFGARSSGSTAGTFRLANNTSVGWRNAANSGNLELKVNASDELEFNGNVVTTLALGAANTVLKVNSGATATEYGLLANANIDASAAIAFSKLASLTSAYILVGSAGNVPTAVAVTGDIGITNGGVTSISSGVIVNDDINASAAIAFSKLASLTSAYILVGNGSNVPTAVAVTGDISISNAGVTAISSDVIVDADINSAAAIARTKIASGTANHVIINNGSGVLSSEATLAKSRGGTGADNSAVTFPATGVIVTEGATQTLTSKTLAIPYHTTGTDLEDLGIAPSNPSAGVIRLYTESGVLKIRDSAGTVTTFGAGLASLNGETGSTQTFSVGTSGTDFNIASATNVHTFNIPDASGSARGLITTGAQTIAGAKTFSSVLTVTATGANVFGSNAGAATTSIAVNAAAGQVRDVAIYAAGSTQMALRENASNESFLLTNSKNLYLSTDAGTTKHVTVDTSGNVGIGTSSPSGLLHLNTDPAGDCNVIFECAGGSDVNLKFAETDPANEIFAIQYTGSAGSNPNNLFKIRANSDGAAGVDLDAVTITQAGNVGIGTSSPFTIFQVQRNTSSTYSSTGGADSTAFVRTVNNSGLSSEFSTLLLGATSNNTTNNAEVFLSCIQEANGSHASSFSVKVRKADSSRHEVIKATSTGAVTLGPAVTNNYTGQRHIVSGSLFAGNVTSTAESGQLTIGVNVRSGSQNGQTGRTDSTNGGAGIIFSNRSSDSDRVLVFIANQAGDATTTTGDTVGFFTQAGAWTLGPSGGLNGFHTIQAASNNANEGSLEVKNTDTTDANPVARFNTAASGNTTANKIVNFLRGGFQSGAICVNGTGAATFNTYSDIRLKENIKPLEGELSRILNLNPVSFDLKDGSGSNVGFIAQEIEQIYPDSVSYLGPETDEMKSVGGWSKTTARIVKAIQEQQSLIQELKAELDSMRAG